MPTKNENPIHWRSLTSESSRLFPRFKQSTVWYSDWLLLWWRPQKTFKAVAACNEKCLINYAKVMLKASLQIHFLSAKRESFQTRFEQDATGDNASNKYIYFQSMGVLTELPAVSCWSMIHTALCLVKISPSFTLHIHEDTHREILSWFFLLINSYKKKNIFSFEQSSKKLIHYVVILPQC